MELNDEIKKKYTTVALSVQQLKYFLNTHFCVYSICIEYRTKIKTY